MSTEFFSDPDRITYIEADDLVAGYIEAKCNTRTETTSVAVLKYHGTKRSHHNRTRVYDALAAVCAPTDRTRAGRTVFELPDPSDQ